MNLIIIFFFVVAVSWILQNFEPEKKPFYKPRQEEEIDASSLDNAERLREKNGELSGYIEKAKK